MVKINELKPEQIAVDVLSLIAGAILFLSPWVFGYAGEAAAAWNAWIFGALAAVIALGAVLSYRPWQEWVNLFAGLWTIVSPFALAFTGVSVAMTTHLLAGLVIAIASGTKLWTSRNRPLSTA